MVGRMLNTRNFVAIAMLLFGCVIELARTHGAEPSAATPNAPDLVRQVLERERRTYEISSLRFQIESTTTLTPRYLERLRSMGLQPRETASEISEVIFDSRRIRTRYEARAQVELLDVWNGKQRTSYQSNKVQKQEFYALSDSFINGFSAVLPWLQVGSPGFWWSPLAQPTTPATQPDGYALIKTEDYRGRACYRCDSVRALRRLLIGVDDQLLYGVLELSPLDATAELALQSSLAGRTFATLEEAKAYVEELSPQSQREFQQRCDQQRFAAALPSVEYFAEDYREVSPGQFIPWKLSINAFESESGEAYLTRSTETKLIALEVNPQLTDALFEIEIPENATVRSQPYNIWPPLEYQHKKSFSEEEWAAILAPRKDDLSKAQREKAKLEERIGQVVPEFQPSTWRNSDPLTWSVLRGKVAVLDFTADWCGACRRHIPTLSQMHEMRERSGIVVVGIHATGSEAAAIDRFVAETQIDFPLYLDVAKKPSQTTDLGQLFGWFQFDAIPKAVLVDRQGKVAAVGTLEDILLQARELAADDGVRPKK